MNACLDLAKSNPESNYAVAKKHRGPIFVLGLPRSGTTLVDRIIGSHGDVTSMGEISDFALTLNRLGRTANRERLLEACARLEPDRLGQSYLQSISSYGSDTEYFIGKTPVNYLYIGLIAKALPGASIIHVRRRPVDTLMRHWQSVFPDILFDVAYEYLIENQERVSRGLIAHCGLDWEPACL